MQGGHEGDTTFCRGPEMKVKNWGGGVGRTVVSSPTGGSCLQPKAGTKGGRSVLGNESERGLTTGIWVGPAVGAGPAEERMAASGSFPLLVEGSWGPQPPKNLSTKLQMYFQSQKRSGGGECEVRQAPGSPPRFLVLFYPDDGEGARGAGERGPPGSPSREAWGWGARRENSSGSGSRCRKERGGRRIDKARRGRCGAPCAALPGAPGAGGRQPRWVK